MRTIVSEKLFIFILAVSFLTRIALKFYLLLFFEVGRIAVFVSNDTAQYTGEFLEDFALKVSKITDLTRGR